MSLAAENRQIMDLTRRVSAPGVRRTIEQVALIALTSLGVWAALGTWWLLPAMVAQGIALCSCFAPLHESVHRTVFAQRTPNDWLAAVCGAIMVLPARWYRHFHMEHHRFTQIEGRDPELAIKKPETLTEYLIYVSGFHYWVRQGRALVRHALGAQSGGFVPERERAAVAREARIHLALYGALAVCVAVGWTAPLWFWALPLLLGQPFLRLYLLAEHTGCPNVADIWTNTRTTISTRFVRWLMWNMPYHAEHHAFPAVPFHALPALHRRVGSRFEWISPGYGRFHKELVGELRAADAA